MPELNAYTRALGDFAPGSFGCHEALHMAGMLAALVDEQLVNHLAIKANSLWHAKALAAATLLEQLYQDIGAAHL